MLKPQGLAFAETSEEPCPVKNMEESATQLAQRLGTLAVQWLLSCSPTHWQHELPRTYSRL